MNKTEVKEADKKFDYLIKELGKVLNKKKKPRKADLKYWYWIGKQIIEIVEKIPKLQMEDKPYVYDAVKSITPDLFSSKSSKSKRIRDFIDLALILSKYDFESISKLSWTNYVDLFDIEGFKKEKRAFDFVLKCVQAGKIQPTQDEIRRLAPLFRKVLVRRNTSRLTDEELFTELNEVV